MTMFDFDVWDDNVLMMMFWMMRSGIIILCKILTLGQEYDVTSNSLLTTEGKLCDLEKELGKHEEEISALSRRQQLLEGDNKQADEKVDIMDVMNLSYFDSPTTQLASNTLGLGQTSRNADNILKQVKLHQ